jgi:Protein of unknown function (DUF2933)
MPNEPTVNSPRWYRTRSGQVLLGSLGLAGIYLLTEYWDHTVSYLPWLLLAACPLMHVFMHGSHGGHGTHHHDRIGAGAPQRSASDPVGGPASRAPTQSD